MKIETLAMFNERPLSAAPTPFCSPPAKRMVNSSGDPDRRLDP